MQPRNIDAMHFLHNCDFQDQLCVRALSQFLVIAVAIAEVVLSASPSCCGGRVQQSSLIRGADISALALRRRGGGGGGGRVRRGGVDGEKTVADTTRVQEGARGDTATGHVPPLAVDFLEVAVLPRRGKCRSSSSRK